MRTSIIVSVCAIALGACGGGIPTTDRASQSSIIAMPSVSGMAAGRYIKHIVIIVQENRSFDNIFAGFPKASSQSYGYMHDGTKVTLQAIPFQKVYIDHYYSDAVRDYDNGKMDGFDLQLTSGGVPIGSYPYSYLERNLVKPYWALAKRYVLVDHLFPTIQGGSFTGHLALIAGTSDLSPTLADINYPSNEPWGCDAPSGTTTDTLTSTGQQQENGPFPCFTQFRTMADTLDAAGVSWKYYDPTIGNGGGMWTAFDAIENVRYGKDWKANVVTPPTKVLKDAAKGSLPNVSWVIPDALWSDHPDIGTPYGPSWVAAVVNAIGKSKEWRSTAIVVVWDDWGGFFDNVPPPQLDFRGLGLRVPCIIISPYVKPHVGHTQYEFGSILKFVEQVFHLPTLGPESEGYTDGRAASLLGEFDFTIAPRPYKVIKAPYPSSFFLQHAPSLLPPDDE